MADSGISMIAAPDGMIVMPVGVQDPMPVLALIVRTANGSSFPSSLAIDHNGKLMIVAGSDGSYGFIGDETAPE